MCRPIFCAFTSRSSKLFSSPSFTDRCGRRAISKRSFETRTDHLLARNAVGLLGEGADQIDAAAGDDEGLEAVGAQIVEQLDLRLVGELRERAVELGVARRASQRARSGRTPRRVMPACVANNTSNTALLAELVHASSDRVRGSALKGWRSAASDPSRERLQPVRRRRPAPAAAARTRACRHCRTSRCARPAGQVIRPAFPGDAGDKIEDRCFRRPLVPGRKRIARHYSYLLPGITDHNVHKRIAAVFRAIPVRPAMLVGRALDNHARASGRQRICQRADRDGGADRRAPVVAGIMVIGPISRMIRVGMRRRPGRMGMWPGPRMGMRARRVWVRSRSGMWTGARMRVRSRVRVGMRVRPDIHQPPWNEPPWNPPPPP